MIKATYENGVLRPQGHVPLRPGERVNLLVVRESDPARWDLDRLRATALDEDDGLTEQGMEDWLDQLEAEDQR